jgi:hypothetical protein
MNKYLIVLMPVILICLTSFCHANKYALYDKTGSSDINNNILQRLDTTSFQDSILLRNFWTDFTEAIESNDKDKLATLCAFPFYCRPCIDDTTLQENDHVTIKVTKTLFYISQYKVFFKNPIKDEVEKHKYFQNVRFYQVFDDKNRSNGFMFSYTIVPPSKIWEGSQGFIYLNKTDGKFKITGMDKVP